MPYACAILSSVACPALLRFSALSCKRHLKKKFEHKMCVSIFSTTYVWSIFHSKKNWLRYDRKNILVYMKSTCYSFDILMKIGLPWHFFLKFSLICRKTPSSGSRIVPCRWTDMMNVIVTIHYFANVPNDENLSWYDMIYILLTAIGLTPSGSSTVHIYTQTIHRTTQWNRIPRIYIIYKIIQNMQPYIQW
jgi:hypothetical protein